MSFLSFIYEKRVYVIIYIVILCILITQIKIIYVSSESIPYRYCLQIYNIQPKKGCLCAIEVDGKTIVKYISGVEGDYVHSVSLSNGIYMYVNNHKIGRVIHNENVSILSNVIIPTNKVFVSGTHAYSFDSRYKEFGLIDKSKLNGLVLGLLKW